MSGLGPGREPLPPSLFLVLALLAEGEAHGYRLEHMAWERGFRYWTDIGRSSIYAALRTLQREGLAEASLSQGGGPPRRVLRITEAGRQRLRDEAAAHLERPAHPRSEIDLGLYALPFLEPDAALASLRSGYAALAARRDFLAERLEWCRARHLPLAALNFERPLLALEAELAWLQKLIDGLAAGDLDLRSYDWQRYEYLEPPGPEFA